MPRRHRFILALLVAALAAAYVLISPTVHPGYISDWDQLHDAARAWRAGQNPYDVVLANHRARGVTFGLVYPFTAVVVALPFSVLSLEDARALFVALSAGCFTYLLLARWWLFPLLLSGSFRSAISAGQIAPFVACAVMVPAFGWVAAYKPNIGLLTMTLGQGRRWAVVYLGAATALLAVSLALWPQWPLAWFRASSEGEHLTPMVMRPMGWVLLLAALRWRRPEAHWLLALAVIPTTPNVYDALPLLVVLCTSFREALVFAILSGVADVVGYAIPHPDTMAGLNTARAVAVLWLLYVPVMVVLMRRPHEVR